MLEGALGGDSEQERIVSWLWPAELPSERLDVLEGLQKRRRDDGTDADDERPCKSNKEVACAEEEGAVPPSVEALRAAAPRSFQSTEAREGHQNHSGKGCNSFVSLLG